MSRNAGTSWRLAGWLAEPEASRRDTGQHDATDRQQRSPAIYEPNRAGVVVKPGIGHGHPPLPRDLTLPVT
jgi:hypothetical protein